MIHHPVFLQGAPRRAEKRGIKMKKKQWGEAEGWGTLGMTAGMSAEPQPPGDDGVSRDDK